MPNSYGTLTALSGNANSLATNTYVSLGTIDLTAAPPHEVFIEVALQASTTPSGTKKQALIFVRDSLDGTNYSEAPSSTTEPNAVLIGVLSMPDSTARRSRAFPVSPAFGGALPRYLEVYVKNDDIGVALAASAQTGKYQTETFG